MVFDMMHKPDTTWSDVVHASGYYDQSHFIRNFKAFTGEGPGGYLFSSPNLANFFLKKTNKSDLYNTVKA